MVFILFVLVISSYIFTFLTMLVLAIIGTFRFFKLQLSTFLWLSLAALLTASAAFFEILSVTAPTDYFSNLYIRIAYESFALLIISTILFIESYTQEFIRAGRVSIIAFIIGIYSLAFTDPNTMELKNFTLNLYDYSKDAVLLSIIAVLTFSLLAFWVTRGFIRALKTATSQSNKQRIRFMIIGFIMASIFTPLLKEFAFNVITENEFLQGVLAGILANIFLAIGTAFLTIPYLTSKDTSFLLPQNYYHLLIVNDIGLLVWQYNFSENKEIEAELFSGAITAISSIIKESTGFQSDLQSIRLKDKIFSVSVFERIAGVMITDH
ncbi:MAG: hypothetical protein ACTSPI_05460, partial [Candidatus Heimdallarchaeaceae archaeon]